jgi:hypothetical protein
MVFKSATRVSLLALLLPVGAQARGSGGDEHLLSTAGGIAAPSYSSGVEGENPAGLVYVPNTLFHGSLSSGNDSFSPLGWGAGLYLGNGKVGGALGVAGSTASGSDPAAHLGLAATIDALSSAVGVAAFRSFDGDGVEVNAGFITKPGSDFRVGGTVFGINDGANSFAAGLATEVGSGATFAVDAGYNTDSEGLVVKPGLTIGVSGIRLGVGYGIDVKKGGAPIGRDFSAGLGIGVGSSTELQFYYNQLARWYGGLSYSF